jgi:hypothetical protein
MKIDSLTVIYPDVMADNWHKNMKTYLVTWDYVKKRKVKRDRGPGKIISIKPF